MPSTGRSNPCCCSLQSGTCAIGIVETVASTIALAALIWISVLLGNEAKQQYGVGLDSGYDTREDRLTSEYQNKLNGYLIFAFIMVLFSLGLGVLLILGSVQRNLNMCKVWYCISMAFFIMNLVLTIVLIFMGHYKELVSDILSLVLQGYFLKVVYAFIQELKTEPASVSNLAVMWSRKEMV